MNNSLRTLLAADARNVLRDEMLKYLLFYPLILGLLLRWLIPFVQRGIADFYDMTPLHPLLVSYFGIVLVPAICGLLIGFLLLDERDTGTLNAIEVTPFSSHVYLGYRLVIPMLIALASIFLIIPLMGTMRVNFAAVFAIGMVASLVAPLIALILVTFAANKVQGLVVMKGASLLLSAPFAAWFVPEPWQWLFGIVPTFWTAKAFWVQQAGGNWLWILGMGIVVVLVWLAPLLRGLDAAMRRGR